MGYYPADMSDQQKSTVATVLSALQLGVLVVGVAGMFMMIGRRDQQLTEATTDIEKLAGVVNDLAKAQASSAVLDAVHAKELQQIQQRLIEIERKIH